MRDDNAPRHMCTLFKSYHELLRRHDVRWVYRRNVKIAVWHITYAVRPETLCTQLHSDFSYCFKHLKK